MQIAAKERIILMLDISNLYSEYSDDIASVSTWSTEVYDNNFKSFFELPHNLCSRLNSKIQPITDDELSQILIDCPLQLFSASEALSQFKISQQVIKLRTAQKRAELIKSSSEATNAKKQEVAELGILEDKLLQTVYGAIVDRVEREISFCRELIMGAKKIWDSRRRTEESNPVSEVAELPDYNRTSNAVQNKHYIR